MPTPVSTAKQCLTQQAAHALDEAVSVARVRNHAQTTSLHVVSAFLSLPSSPLRDACLRARNAAFYSTSRTRIRALEFALSVSLDRSAASTHQRVSEPPISNSLMAAIKRSQACQRRQPDGFCYNQEPPREPIGSAGVKVEIQHLTIAILDDPIVSRVFTEAGFSSLDVKLSLLRPLQGFWRYSNNNKTSNSGIGDDEFRRIGEVFGRKKGRNPLIFGVCARDAVLGFVERWRKGGSSELLPPGVRGARVVSLVSEIGGFRRSDEVMRKRFGELGEMAEDCCGPGLVVCFGDLKELVEEEGLVAEFTRLIERCRDRIWLIGCATYEVYLKFLSNFPCADKDWDLQPLAITSMKSVSKADMCFKSSMMGSFVPFAGFFPTSSDFKGALRSSYQLPTRSDPFSKRSVQELVTSGSGYNSVANRCQTTLPSWLRMAEIRKCNGSDTLKDEEDVVGMRTNVASCHETLEDERQNFLCTTKGAKASSGEEEARTVSKSDKNIHAANKGRDEWNSAPKVDHKDPFSLAPMNKSFLFSLSNPPSTTASHSSAPHVSPFDSGIDSDGIDCQQSLSCGISVATDLVLGLSHPKNRESKTFSETKLLQDFSSCSPVDFVASDRSSLPHSCPELPRPLDSNNFKSLYLALIGRVGWQEEAVRIISQTISHFRTSNGGLKGSSIQGDVWMNFLGSDTIGMRKTALALAEVVCGNKANLIHIDLSLQDGYGSRLSSCLDESAHRKPMVDHISNRLSKTPLSVVFLENIQCAHAPAQNSLLRAIRSGKFMDSCGREVGIGNAIFLLSSALKTGVSGCATSSLQGRVENAKPWPMQITVNTPITTVHHNSVPSFFTKRKLHSTEEMPILQTAKRPCKGPVGFLDLNLPADEFTIDTHDPLTYEFACYSWLEELSSQVDGTAVFKPFDYGTLAKETAGLIQVCFSKYFCAGCVLEIDPRAMDQVLAAARLLDRSIEVEAWLESVVSKSFVEARKRYHSVGSHSVVKLATTDRCLYGEEEKETCEWLPSKIILHCQP